VRFLVAGRCAVLCVAIAGCADGGAMREPAANDAGGGSGGLGGAGVSGFDGSGGAGGLTGGSGGLGGSGGTGGSAQPACPRAQSLPQDGAWSTTGSVIESDCPGIAVGAADTRFTTVTITTADLGGRIDRDLHLVASTGESFRGFVRDDEARLSGPLENYPDRPLNIALTLLFAGDCFTAHVREDRMDGARPCMVRYSLQGER